MGFLELLGGAIVAVIAAYFYGRNKGVKGERQKQDLANAKDQNEVRRRVQASRVDDDADSKRERMRDRANKR